MPGRWISSGSSSPGSTSSSTSAMVTRPAMAQSGLKLRAALVEDEVAVAVALPGPHEAEVGDDRLLEHVRLALTPSTVEVAGLLRRRGDRDRAVGVVAPRQAALGDLGAGRRSSCRTPGMPAPPARSRSASVPCGVSSTSSSPCEVLPRELLVLADVGGDHPADPLVAQQDAEPPVVDAAVVRDGLEVAHPRIVQGGDQHARDAAEPEPADREGGPVDDPVDGLSTQRRRLCPCVDSSGRVCRLRWGSRPCLRPGSRGAGTPRYAAWTARTSDTDGARGVGDEYQLCNSTNLLVAGCNQWDK